MASHAAEAGPENRVDAFPPSAVEEHLWWFGGDQLKVDVDAMPLVYRPCQGGIRPRAGAPQPRYSLIPQRRGGPISGVRSGAAMPTKTTTWWPPGLLWIGAVSQLFATQTFPEGSTARPVLRTRPSKP
jgi:hypothetical protein